MPKNRRGCARWRRPAMFVMLAVPYAACAQPTGSSADRHRDAQAVVWKATPRVPQSPYRHTFTGRGVTVGVLDYDFGEHDARQALDGVMQRIGSFSSRDLNDHGLFVSRIIAGKDIGDGLGQGMAHGSRVIAFDADESPYFTHLELAGRGARIINHSFSVLSYAQLIEMSMEGLHEINDRIVEQDDLRDAVWWDKALMIWATGNDGMPGPALPAASPVLFHELEHGWIAVTWLDGDGLLDPDANACGAASNWCISAPGSYRLNNGIVREGTSFAAPVVTATAALVSEAYPWMDNHALRQTLLSTADPMGDRKYFGWGRLNPDRAVRGPALFDSRLTFYQDFVADFDGGRSEFFNDIGGDQGLVKAGSGTLTLWGKNTYAGNTEIRDGVLELFGSVAATVHIQRHGTLFADGAVIGGSVFNRNLLRAHGAGLHIKRDLYTEGARLQVQLGSTVTVGHTAYLRGARLEIANPDPRYLVSRRETIVRAGRIDGQFASLQASPLFTVSPIYTPTQVDILVERNNVQAIAQTAFDEAPAKQAAARAVETSFRVIDHRWREAMVGACGYDSRSHLAHTGVSPAFVRKAAALQRIESLPDLDKTLDSLTGEVYASSQALSFQQAQTINRSLSNRVDALNHDRQPEGLWVALSKADGKLRQRGYRGADTRVSGFQLGADQRLGHNNIIGAAVSWSAGQASFEGLGGRSKGQSIGVSLYARHGASVGNYVSGRIGHDWIDTDVSRVIQIDQPERIESGRSDRMASVYAEFGHVFAASEATLTPFVGAQYNHLRRGAFAENGSAFALAANRATYQQIGAVLGARYQSAPMRWAGEIGRASCRERV